MRLGIAALPGCFDSGLATFADVMRAAERLRVSVDRSIAPIEVQLLGTESVRTAAGLLAEPDLAFDDQAISNLDRIVVPGLATGATPRSLRDSLATIEVRRLHHWLSRADHDLPLAAACTGTFVLAAAGRLENRTATTSWWLADYFRQLHPSVRLEFDQMVVHSGPIITAGAAFAHIDLAMELVGEVSPRLAHEVARYLLIDARPSLGIAAVTSHLATTDPLVIDFEEWIRHHLDDETSVTSAAAAIGTTRRTLERRCRAALGISPHAVISRLRVERATHLQQTTTLSIDQIAPLVGYRNGSTLRALLRTHGEAASDASSATLPPPAR